MKAKNIALSAYEQAKAAAEQAKAAAEAEARAEEERKRKRHLEVFEAALPTLNLWFPGVEWDWTMDGDFGNDIIVWDASEDWPPSFKLCVHKKGMKGAIISVGDYVQDTSMPGYRYFQGVEVKSAADIGRYLER